MKALDVFSLFFYLFLFTFFSKNPCEEPNISILPIFAFIKDRDLGATQKYLSNLFFFLCVVFIYLSQLPLSPAERRDRDSSTGNSCHTYCILQQHV